jgi:hypothetical protein
MRPLRNGQETVLSWSAGAVDCRVVAAAGSYILLRPLAGVFVAEEPPEGPCSLTYLDGMVPMGWDGRVECGSTPGDLRFRVDRGLAADRRSAVRIPVTGDAEVVHLGARLACRVLDVSSGGMRLRTPKRRLAVGSKIHVKAQLPGDGPAVDTAAIVRQTEPGVAAVEFVALPPNTAQAIGVWAVERMRSALAGQG